MQPGVKVGPFVIEKELGAGAMGTVYRAVHVEARQRVAIKVMAPGVGTSETAHERFKRETSILKQLKHPNIVRLLAIGRYHNAPFYAMEYVEGESLDKVLARRDRLSWDELIPLGQQLCAALQHAHDQGIVHRDLKPSNVMLLPDGTIKLTDFGIAKDLDQTALTATNCTVGTASYMSPEQCRGDKNIGPSSDLYSLGVMFYELVTGRKPFEAESAMELFLLHVNGKFVRPARLVPDIPVWLDNLIVQLLEKKPDQRPYNAMAVAEALQNIKEKVEAQLSAGVAAASARAIDRPKDQPMDEADIEAARALLGKKKKKKKKPPFYTQGWFTKLSVGLIALTMLVVIWYVFIKIPDAEYLHSQAAALMKITNDDLASWREARRGPLADFLYYYSQREDEIARQMRQWADDIDFTIRERQMHNRRKQKLKDNDDKLERLANDALDEEDAGNLDEARLLWDKLAKYRNDEDPDRHAWGLVGERYRKNLDDFVLGRKGKAQQLWEMVWNDPRGLKKGESPEEALAIKAIRAEQAQNIKEAREHWAELKRKTADEWEHRRWYLMAAKKVRELKEK